MSSVISAVLASYLETPLHTLFQISTSGSLVEGVYAQAVTCAKVLGLLLTLMARWSSSKVRFTGS